MRLCFTPNGWLDYQPWVSTDRRVMKRVNELIRDCLRDPFAGIGKPEQLRHHLSGAWSRRITQEHRLVYVVDGDDLTIVSCRYHYRD